MVLLFAAMRKSKPFSLHTMIDDTNMDPAADTAPEETTPEAAPMETPAEETGEEAA